MPTAVIAANAQAIENAARLLRSGEIGALPTETDYGLGADATDDRAVAAIFAPLREALPAFEVVPRC
jgi:L-threonylcarbamoyladenylate synthase